jgi:hypothetical protein
MPNSLPPVAIHTHSPKPSPWCGRHYKPTTSPITTAAMPASPPPTILARTHARLSGTYTCLSHHPEILNMSGNATPPTIGRDSVTPTIRTRDPLPHTDKSDPLSSPVTISSPSPAPTRTQSICTKAPSRFFGRSGSALTTASKSKRRKLVKKSISEPQFIMVSPNPARATEPVAREAAQLGMQLEQAVTAMGRGSIIIKSAGVLDEVTTPLPDSPTEKGKQSAEETDTYAQLALQRETKRWSHAPMLPELDFGSPSIDSTQVFGPASINPHPSPQPSATIYISAMSDPSANSVNIGYTAKSPGKLTYRCDIHAANGASHQDIETACRKLVTDAYGWFFDAYCYPGGFLYALPPGTPEPITACDNVSLEKKIGVEQWMALAGPKFDPLRMHPPGGRLGGGHSSRPIATSVMAEGLKSRQNNGSRLVDSWVESRGTAMVPRPMETASRKETENGDGAGGDMSRDAVEIDTASVTPSRKSNTPTVIHLCQTDTANVTPPRKSNTPNVTPLRKATLTKSLETIRQRAIHTVESSPTTSDNVQSPGNSNSRRYTVLLNAIDSDSDSDSDSGAEEWESVRSALDSL